MTLTVELATYYVNYTGCRAVQTRIQSSTIVLQELQTGFANISVIAATTIYAIAKSALVDRRLLDIPHSRTKTSWRRFSLTVPRVLNGLPATVRVSPVLIHFRIKLKTHLYRQRPE